MRVEFIKNCEVLAYPTEEDAQNDTNEYTRLFNVGDIVILDIVGHPKRWDNVTENFVYDPDHVNIQLSDGSVAGCVSRDWFKVVG